MNNFSGTYFSGNQKNSYFNPAPGASASTNNIIWVQGIEGAKAWQKHLELKTIDFNISNIFEEQEELYCKYKEKIKCRD